MNENNEVNSDLLNVNQAAEFLGVNVGTIRRWARAKTLTGINVGVRGDWRFTKKDLLKMIKTNNNSTDDSLRIVGIGASAGGLEAATQLLKSLPTNLGLSYVLVQHLDPTHESILAELLAKTTRIPVGEVKDNTKVEPDHVYVIPYNKDMTIADGILQLTDRDTTDKHHMPIDHFFQSLAESQRDKAVGVILSGTATDGTLGCQAIKNKGGITFAQDKSAKYLGMPRAAINAGYVDFVMSPIGIAKEISKISSNTSTQQVYNDKDGLFRILFLLRKNFGIDFRHYKEATIKRRVKRRMQLHKINTLREYAEYIKTDDKEIESLRDDLLINVTSFFREPQTFQFLHDIVFPRLIKNRSLKEAIRIWVPGCATGEEVYSIAISVFEFLAENSVNIPVQIFGTDLSKQAIEKARTGTYSQGDIDNISVSRLERFFEKSDGDYQVIKSIREMCIFAPHNVFGDPPFSRLDLISCCNLLIYLDINLQNKILRAFHFALKPESFLVLGKSESVNSSPELFSQIDKKVKIFTKKVFTAKSVIDLDTFVSRMDKSESGRNDMFTDTLADSSDIQKEADKILLNHYTPASVIVDNELEIIQFRGSTGIFLEPSPGKASFNLIKMAREGLGFELRSAISKVRKDQKAYKKKNILIKHNNKTLRVTIEVIPLRSISPGTHFLVLFEETNVAPLTESLPNDQQVRSKPGTKDKRIKELEEELSQIREDMMAVTEEQEATNEELQTTSEEILSSNEELQSINEELETSKEELESTNEELNTLNDELQNRNEQLVEARDYAEAIIRTVQVPLLILDSDLRVKTANRYFYEMFQVDGDDTTGKFIYDLGNGQWNIPALKKLLNEILPKDNYFDNYEIEHVFPKIGRKNMLLNGRKFYKDGNNILLTIEDITTRRDIEKQKDMFIGLASHELKTPITTIKGYAQMLGKQFSPDNGGKNEYLVININKQVDRLVKLVNDLLNTSKIQAGKLELEKQKFDLNELVSQIIADFNQVTESHQIIKEGEAGSLVFADKNRIEQTLTNLVTNAIKYSPQANKIIVRVSSDDKKATVSVQDFGDGIDKRDQSRIFERFYRSDKKKDTDASGFGLGLFIASEIIKEHHGKIWVESEIGKGSTFYFSLPL